MSRSRGRSLLATGVLLGTVLFLVVAAVWAVGLLRAEEESSAADAPLSDQCAEVPDGATRLVLEADDGFRLGAALVGSEDAPTGLVIRQGAGQTLCDWLPRADRIASATGTRVLLFDRRGKGSSPGDEDLEAEPGDTVRAVRWLRSQGATRIGLLAASVGNSVMFSALPDLPAPPCVVVSVSPVLTSSDGTGSLDATTLGALPGNVWVVAEAGDAVVAEYADAIVEASGTDHQLMIDTDDHSIGLLRRHPEVGDFVDRAVASCAR